MSDPTLTSRMLILLGDGGDPEVFAFPCGAGTRSITLTKNTGEEALLDCTNPLDVPAAVTRWMVSDDTQVSFSGRISTEAWATWRAWADAVGAAAVKNIRILMDEALANGGGYWVLPAVLTSFEMSTEGTGTTTFSATIQGAGRRVWTDAAA